MVDDGEWQQALSQRAGNDMELDPHPDPESLPPAKPLGSACPAAQELPPETVPEVEDVSILAGR